MKCPICETEVSDYESKCPNCKIDLYDDKENLNENVKDNADHLEILANINLVIFIASSIVCFCGVITEIIEYGSIENYVLLITGVSSLLVGFTLYYLLKTVADIYNKLNNKF